MKQYPPSLWALLAGLILAMGGFVWLQERQVTPQTSVATPKVYSEAEIHAFWDAHMLTLIRDQILKGSYSIPEINDHFRKTNEMISKRYGKPLTRYEMIATANDKSTLVLFGNQLDKGEPVVKMFIPSMIRVYDDIRRSGRNDWQQAFELVVVVGMLHELDHLAYGFAVDKDTPPTAEKLVYDEKGAWAVTCQEVIRPLITKYHLPLTFSEQVFYKNWVAAGRNVEDPRWEAFIRHVHQEVLPH